MVMAEDEQFLQILTGLSSEENEIRTRAEKTYDEIELTRRASLLIASTLNAALSQQHREMAAVLLRRVFFSKWSEFYPSLSGEAQSHLKQQILAAVRDEHSDTMRRKLCEIAAEMARNMLDDDGNNLWPEFLTFLFDSARSQVPQHRECALQLFCFVPGVFGNQQQRYMDVIVNMLHESLVESSFKCRFLAFKATSQFIVDNMDSLDDTAETRANHKHIHTAFSRLVPPLFQVLQESIAAGDDCALLQSCISLAEAAPRMLRPQLDNIMQLCLKVMSSREQEDEWRQLSVELVVTIAEEAAAMFRKHCRAYLQPVVEQLLQMMSDIVDADDQDADCSEWAHADEAADDDNECNYVMAESSLDRLACSLGGKLVCPVVLSLVQQMLVSTNWQHRHAALCAVSTIGEGCQKQMESSLPQIVTGVVGFLKDPHPRVRYAACTCLGQMCEDFAPHFQSKYHGLLAPALILAVQDFGTPRVQAQAALALINFSGQCGKSVLANYLDTLFNVLEHVLQTKLKELVEKGTRLVLENVITTIASVADTAEEKFAAYYSRFMPCLKYIVENATSQELRLLRGKAIECISLIGLAVGKEKFLPDASSVMELLLKSQTCAEQMDPDDPQLPCLISAWARMCTIMGEQFAVYLPLVMPSVMQMACVKPEWALLSDDDKQVLNGDADWEMHSFGDNQNFAVRTSVLEDKSNACAMLVCYARELGGEFAPYTQQVAELMTRLLKFYFHEGVRSSAAEIMPHLLKCAAAKGGEYVQMMWSFIVPELLQAIATEPTISVIPDHMHSLAKCIETLNCPCLSDAQMTELFKTVHQHFEKHFEKSRQRDEKRRDEDYDEEVEEELVDEDDEYSYIISRIADILHALFIVYREQVLPLFDTIVPHLNNLLVEGRPWTERQWALCVWDDVIEYCGPASLNYTSHFVEPITKYILDSQPEVCQAAVYGCGVMAQFGGVGYRPLCGRLVPHLAAVVQRPDAREPDWISASENAIAAVAKILKYTGRGGVGGDEGVDVQATVPLWFSWLPVWQDTDETPHVYGYLCDLVEANDATVLGASNDRLPRVIAVMAEALARRAIATNEPVGVRMMALIRQIQSNEELFHACVVQLSDQQKEALQEALSSSVQASETPTAAANH